MVWISGCLAICNETELWIRIDAGHLCSLKRFSRFSFP